MIDPLITKFGGWIAQTIVWEWFRYEIKHTLRGRFRKPVGHFIPPEDYYGRFLGKRSQQSAITHELPCIAREDEINRLLGTVDGGEVNVFLITAPPGHGKSRFALELARRLTGAGAGFRWRLGRALKGKTWNVYFAQHFSTEILEHVEELRKKPRTVVFIDNAHESPDLVKALSTYAGVSRSEGRLLLFCISRTSTSNLVIDALDHVLPEEVSELALKKLGASEIATIVRERLPDLQDRVVDRVVGFTKDSLFLTVLVCQLIKKGEDFSDKVSDRQFRRRICDAPLEQATAPCGINYHKVSCALAVLAAASPVNYLDPKIKDLTCRLGDISPADFDCLIKKSFNSGLFTKFAKSLLKPTPDLIGDLVLDSVCVNDDGTVSPFANSLMSELLDIQPENVLNNLADLGWTVGQASGVDVVTPFLEKVEKNIESYGIDDIKVVLEWMGPLAIRKAPPVTAIIDSIWARSKNEISIGRSSSEEWDHLIGATVPTLVAAASDERVLEKVMSILKEYVRYDTVSTPYENHKPENSLAEVVAFSPHRSVEHTARALSILENWFNAGGEDAVVALQSLSELLSPAVHWRESKAFELSFHSSPLLLSESVRAVRKRAIAILVKGLLSAHSKIQSAAFSTVDAIGRYRYGASYEQGSDIAKLIDEEKKTVVSTFKEILDKSVSHAVARKIEERLWNWWCHGSNEVAIACEDVLEKTPKSAEYQLSKVLYHGDLPIDLTVAQANERGELGRSEYFFGLKRDEAMLSREKLMKMLRELKIGDDPSEWKRKFEEITEDKVGISWRACDLFSVLAENNPRTGWQFIGEAEKSPWNHCVGGMLIVLKMQDRKRWEEELRAFLQRDVSAPVMLNWLESFDWHEGLDDYQWEVVEKLTDQSDFKCYDFVARSLAHGAAQDWERAARCLLKIASRYQKEEKIIDHLFSRLSRKRPHALKTALGSLDRDALAFLERDDLGSYIPWDRPYWCGQYLGVVASIDADRFLEFVGSTLENIVDSAKQMQFSVLGARNAKKAFQALIHSGLKRSHIRQFIAWASSDSVLGEFTGSVLARNMLIGDPDIRDELDRMYRFREFKEIARLVSRYAVTQEWLEEVKRLLIESDRSGYDVFSNVEKIISHRYWKGSTKRTVGKPTEQDKIVTEICGGYAEDTSLPIRIREYFAKRKKEAEERIEKDIASDEAIAGEKLT